MFLYRALNRRRFLVFVISFCTFTISATSVSLFGTRRKNLLGQRDLQFDPVGGLIRSQVVGSNLVYAPEIRYNGNNSSSVTIAQKGW